MLSRREKQSTGQLLKSLTVKPEQESQSIIWKCYFQPNSTQNDDPMAPCLTNMQHIYFRIEGSDLFAFKYVNKPDKIKFMHTLPGCSFTLSEFGGTR
jgi:hypothetical protein